MPFYTFKCPNCDVEKEILSKMDSSNPMCNDCATCGCNRADGTCGCGGKMKSIEMNRVFTNVGKHHHHNLSCLFFSKLIDIV